MYGASFKLKSPWNMIFDIDAEYNETEDVNYASNNILHRQGRINNTRSYHNMNICNKDIWLSYTNKQNWASNDDENSILDKRNNILAPINVYNVPGANPSMIYTYQQVERIKGIKTFGLYPKHKSNIYSIRIKDSGLNNNLNANPDFKAQIQKGLNTVIRNMVTKTSPVNTMLWKIIWEGS